jgi:hypothetical protein
MSARGTLIPDSGGGGGSEDPFEAVDNPYKSSISIGGVEVPLVYEYEWAIPFHVEKDVDGCGTTQATQNGDDNFRFTCKAVVRQSTLEDLIGVAAESEDVEVVGPVLSKNVTFETLRFKHNKDEPTLEGGGEEELMFNVQLQSKQTDGDETFASEVVGDS